MAEPRSGIIKRKDVSASGAMPAADALTGRSVRIPAEQVATQGGDERPPEPFRVAGRLRRENTVLSDRPVEVGPGPIERPKPHPTPREADEPREPTIAELEEAWSARLDQARREAREEGIAQGLAEAESAFKEQVTALRTAFAADLESIQQSWESFVRRAEPWILQLSFRVAGAVLDAPVPDDVRRVNERAVASAVESMADGIPLEVVLHPVSFLRIKESGIFEQLASNNSKLRWRTNTEIKQNEWIVQSQRAVTRRLESELIEQLRHELSLLEIHRPDDPPFLPHDDEPQGTNDAASGSKRDANGRNAETPGAE